MNPESNPATTASRVAGLKRQATIRAFSVYRYIASLLAVGMGLAGCSPRPHFPWSLEGKPIPAFKIVHQEEVSTTDPITFSLSVVVPEAISKEDLTRVSQKVIEDLPTHSLVVIFYYSDPKEASGDFTVGKAWWGVDDDKNFPPPGDYSHNVLKVDRKR